MGNRKPLPITKYLYVSIYCSAFILQTGQGKKYRQWKERTERRAYKGGIWSKIQL